MSPRLGMLTVEQLRVEVDGGRIDTVLVAIPDMQGRLQGKRLHAAFFLDSVLQDGTEGCNFLLAVDVDMNTVAGYALSSWENGYGDFVMRPDLDTLRRVPWHEGTAMVLCDLEQVSGGTVAPSPRQILREQSARPGAHGWQALVGTELEFLVFRDTYEAAQTKHYADLVPANLYNVDYSPVFAAGPDATRAAAQGHRAGFSPVLEHFPAGQLAGMRELTLLLAPNINSYERFVEGSFAPTAVRWGHDNRTCALRVIGHGRSLRFENRLPGGDVNPYLAVAAIIAAGLDGVDRELPPESAFTGNAYGSDSETVPTTLREALTLWEASALAQAAFGSEVVDHYANMARVEISAFDRATTDWERARGFERL